MDAEHDGFVATGQVVLENGLDGDGDPAWRWSTDGIDDLTLLGMLTVMTDRLRERVADNIFSLSEDDDEDELIGD